MRQELLGVAQEALDNKSLRLAAAKIRQHLGHIEYSESHSI
jgi:hypothetical protein